MKQQTSYILFRFKGINDIVFTDDNKFLKQSTFKEIKVRNKHGYNGIYINRKFFSLRKLRKLAYKHRELLFKKIEGSCPF